MKKMGRGFRQTILHSFFVFAPYKVDDILYVRETWYYEEHMHEITAGKPDLPYGLYSHRFVFKASNPDYPVDIGVGKNGWSPSIHMPKVAARIFLKVTGVRAERLQNLSIGDADREGIERNPHLPYGYEIGDFETLWDSIYSKRGHGWDKNPWVWVIDFEMCEKPQEEQS